MNRAALRKGWCPGALRPMPAADGLLVRLRQTGGALTATTAQALADMATRFGNGLFDLTARANLQMRGVSVDDLPALLKELAAYGLVDDDAGAESVRNVVASPLAGLHHGMDIRDALLMLEAALVADAALHALPGKFGWLIDDGSAPTLANVTADVRFDWEAEDASFVIGLGGDATTAVTIGTCPPSAVTERAVAIAHRFIARTVGDLEVTRMRHLRARLGDEGLKEAFALPGPTPSRRNARAPDDVVGARTLSGVATLGLAAPFGRMNAAMLADAAKLAIRHGNAELRLTPWRTVLLPGIRSGKAEAPDGFIADPGDPRLRVAACTGMDGCARGTTPTHADAAFLAASLVENGHAATLHVSGCVKGCAKPSVSDVTLVARDGRYDLVRNGRPGDPPVRSGLDLDGCRAALRRMKEPA